jgi:peptidoglycan/LPS O-acetylase OafA/YrhL
MNDTPSFVRLTPATADPVIDWVKLVGSQLIVWHHLAFYGPMSDVVAPLAAAWFDALYDHGRLAVQAFLVAGGFLAARSLWQTLSPGAVASPPGFGALLATVAARYRRLALPLLAALVLAMLAGVLARRLDHPDAPPAPSGADVLAHVFLLQDIVGVDALSAGVWYVAVDFQLFTLFCVLVWAARRVGGHASRHVTLACGALTALSLLWWNRNPELDEWAQYFFGAYGLGIAAWIAVQRDQRMLGALGIALLVIAALWVQWRSRIAVAGVVAAALALLAWRPAAAPHPRWVAAGAAISYEVFLVHYPVMLAVGSVVHWASPRSVPLHAAGLLASWVLSLLVGAALHRALARIGMPRRAAPA